VVFHVVCCIVVTLCTVANHIMQCCCHVPVFNVVVLSHGVVDLLHIMLSACCAGSEAQVRRQ
jgi:hypothetical protein